MKFNYDFIKENLRIYNQVKEMLPVISQYEQGLISQNSMRTLGLDHFSQFYDFTKSQKNMGFEIIQAISYKELKEVIVKNTTVDRFKTYISNRTQPKFKKMISEDSETFDRLLNGRWISKPTYRRRGRRYNEVVSGLKNCFVPLINWIISNDIQTCDLEANHFQSFKNQTVYQYQLRWYTGIHLDVEKLPKREIDITFNLLNSFVDFLTETQTDFRKLNCDFIVENISSKLRSLMNIPTGTIIKSLVDLNATGTLQYSGIGSELTKDKTYKVEDSSINGGYVKVWISNDRGVRNYYNYSLFEDVSVHRDLLLQQLGI
jgi:hypothetical protein